MDNIVLFCEGKETSLDYLVFNKLLTQQSLANITLIPLNGVGSSTAFVDGYIRRGGVLKIDRAYFIRDRDFDFPIPVQPGIIEVKRNGGLANNVSIYSSYRTTLENYLINARILHEFLSDQTPISQCDVQKLIENAARSILDYSIVRHALGKLRKSISLNTTWVPQGSGTLPDLTTLGSLDACRAKAHELINTYQREVAPLNIANFDQYLDSFQAQFSPSGFIQNDDYLVYFHGKDLQKAITKQVNDINIQLSWPIYYKFAIDRIDFYRFEDYQQLMNILVTS